MRPSLCEIIDDRRQGRGLGHPKYSKEVKEAVDNLLEQEELAIEEDPMISTDPMAEDPMAADPMVATAEDDLAAEEEPALDADSVIANMPDG